MEIIITVLSIVACVLLFSLAVFIHEFGHFIAARKLGFKVEAFSIGFGPALWKKKINGVEYRFSAIPFGGYVSLPQLDPEGTKGIQGTQSDGGDELIDEAPAWKRIMVAVAGPFGNIVLAVILACLLAVIPGVRFGELPARIGQVLEKGPAAEAGMMAGDTVKSINGREIGTWMEMQTEVQLTGDKEAKFEVVRDGKDVALSVKPKRDEITGAYLIMALSETNPAGRVSAWMPSRNPMKQLAWDSAQIFRVLKALTTPKEAKAAAKAVGGPVMIAEGLYRQVRSNFWDALGFLRFLCVNLAIMNLLPIPVLDGGLIMFALFELLSRRKVNKKFVSYVTMGFMYLLIGLMLFLVYRDITRSVRIHKAIDAAEKASATNSPSATSQTTTQTERKK